MKKIALLLVSVLLGVNFGFTQDLTSAEEKAQEEQNVKEMIENKDFVFYAKSMKSTTGSRLDLSAYYDLTINGSYVQADLPYLAPGESTWVGEMVSFNDVEAESIDVKYNENRNDYEIFILVNTGTNIYNMKMMVGSNGCAFLTIMSTDFKTVSYFGVIDRPDQLDVYLN